MLNKTCISIFPWVFIKTDVQQICSKFTGEHPCGSVTLINLVCNITKITLLHGCFPVYLLHVCRTPFFEEYLYPAGIYLFKVNNRNTRTRCKICPKLTIKTPERHHWCRLVSLLLTLNIFHTLF